MNTPNIVILAGSFCILLSSYFLTGVNKKDYGNVPEKLQTYMTVFGLLGLVIFWSSVFVIGSLNIKESFKK